ncbi:TPA: hypothetical protein ACH3X1_013558 [Trebouxia sp. C0004]
MVQSDDDTVSEFVREFRLKERELVGTPYAPAGGAIIDFIKKLNPAVRRYVQDNAPEEWWTDVKQVFKKALNFEMNKRAAVQIEPSAHLNTSHDDSQSFKKSGNVVAMQENTWRLIPPVVAMPRRLGRHLGGWLE